MKYRVSLSWWYTECHPVGNVRGVTQLVIYDRSPMLSAKEQVFQPQHISHNGSRRIHPYPERCRCWYPEDYKDTEPYIYIYIYIRDQILVEYIIANGGRRTFFWHLSLNNTTQTLTYCNIIASAPWWYPWLHFSWILRVQALTDLTMTVCVCVCVVSRVLATILPYAGQADEGCVLPPTCHVDCSPIL